jgi:hypothetical protein
MCLTVRLDCDVGFSLKKITDQMAAGLLQDVALDPSNAHCNNHHPPKHLTDRRQTATNAHMISDHQRAFKNVWPVMRDFLPAMHECMNFLFPSSNKY